MHHDPKEILTVLDRCCDAFSFPMLDNGYVYLAATRLSVFYSEKNWAIIIEVFGFSPRSGYPDTHIYTFSNQLFKRQEKSAFVNEKAYENFLANNPNNESEFIYPINAQWFNETNEELVPFEAQTLFIRDLEVPIPSIKDYIDAKIYLAEPPKVYIYELCRYLAVTNRNNVLATNEEKRTHICQNMREVLLLDEWNHPNLVVGAARPSNNEAFQQIALVAATGDNSNYKPSEPPNTHWKNWPEGGLL